MPRLITGKLRTPLVPEIKRREDEPAYLGIDPGVSGGIAYVWHGTILTSPMPDTEKGLWEIVYEWGSVVLRTGGLALLEQVGGFVKGSGGNIGSAMFKFGQSYGACRMALSAAGVPWETCSPARWQNGLKIAKGGAKGTDLKKLLKAHATRLFPGIKVTDKTADALLIAEWCRRSQLGGRRGSRFASPTPE